LNPPRGFFRQTARRSFVDRREAGRALAEELAFYRDGEDVLVLGLARGGVPVAWEIAAALHAPLDVFLVRKLGVPRWSELAMGALASGGGIVMNDDVVSSLHVTDEQVREVIVSERAELVRREHAYRGDRPAADPRGQSRDPCRRRHRHRRQHAGRRPGGTSRRSEIDRRGGPRRTAVNLPWARAAGRQRSVRNHAARVRGRRPGLRRLSPGH
jgi:hypothetical protein